MPTKAAASPAALRAASCIPSLAGITSWRWWPSGSGAPFSGGQRSGVLPIVFPMVMAVGAAVGLSGLQIPAVETGIAVSAIVRGAVVAFAGRPPIWVAAAIVGSFAIFHGYAHGVELSKAADPRAYSLGFVIATAMLHLVGIAIGLVVRWPAGRVAVRAVGAAIAMAGIAFLTGYATARGAAPGCCSACWRLAAKRRRAARSRASITSPAVCCIRWSSQRI